MYEMWLEIDYCFFHQLLQQACSVFIYIYPFFIVLKELCMVTFFM